MERSIAASIWVTGALLAQEHTSRLVQRAQPEETGESIPPVSCLLTPYASQAFQKYGSGGLVVPITLLERARKTKYSPYFTPGTSE